MQRLIALVFGLMIILSGCSSPKTEQGPALMAGQGGKYHGGTFKYNEEEYLKSLYPLNITDVISSRTINQIYEGLLAFNMEDLTTVPRIAESYEISEDGTIYTFKIRPNVYFHDDPCFPDGKGRLVTAHDFKYCLDRLYQYNPAENQAFKIFADLIKGGDEYLEETKKDKFPEGGVSGVNVVDNQTLTIELKYPNATFLSKMALPGARVYPKEAWEKYGSEMRIKTVGTGPFVVQKIVDDQIVFLDRNKNYWGKDDDGNQLPYLDHIAISFIKEKKTVLQKFKMGDFDMMYRLPLEMKDEVVDIKDNLQGDYQKFQLQSSPVMVIQYYGFLHLGEVFNDVNVRKAFCYAIDRKKLCDFTLKGTGYPANHGIIPPGTGSYDNSVVKGYEYNPGKAQLHLEKAGFPKGEGFPKLTLQLNSGGQRNTQVAEAIINMIKENLNIDIEQLQVPFAQHTEAISTAKTDIWRLGWQADYPDPENFLNLFYGIHYQPDLSVKSYVNSFRYYNPEFDKYLSAALKATDEKTRNELYAKADQIVIDDAVVMPIFHDKDYRLLQPYVRNLPQNSMEYRNFREVYFVPE